MYGSTYDSHDFCVIAELIASSVVVYSVSEIDILLYFTKTSKQTICISCCLTFYRVLDAIEFVSLTQQQLPSYQTVATK